MTREAGREESCLDDLFDLAPLLGCVVIFQTKALKVSRFDLLAKLPTDASRATKCSKNKGQKSAVPADRPNEYLAKMIKADGILLGSPVYFADATAGIKVLIKRCGMVSSANEGFFESKAGAAVAAVKLAGAIRTFCTLNNRFAMLAAFS